MEGSELTSKFKGERHWQKWKIRRTNEDRAGCRSTAGCYRQGDPTCQPDTGRPRVRELRNDPCRRKRFTMKVGFVSLPFTGHLNPMAALARKVQTRGHKVIFIGIPDIEP